MSKTLLEWLKNYHPSDYEAELLNSSDPETIRIEADKEVRAMRIYASFSSYIPKKILYSIEKEVTKEA